MIGCCFVLLQSSWLGILSGYLILRFLRRHRLVNTCSFWSCAFVSFHVSDPYSNTALTFELKMVSFEPRCRCLLFLMDLREFGPWQLHQRLLSSWLYFPCTQSYLPPLLADLGRCAGRVDAHLLCFPGVNGPVFFAMSSRVCILSCMCWWVKTFLALQYCEHSVNWKITSNKLSKHCIKYTQVGVYI